MPSVDTDCGPPFIIALFILSSVQVLGLKKEHYDIVFFFFLFETCRLFAYKFSAMMQLIVMIIQTADMAKLELRFLIDRFKLYI